MKNQISFMKIIRKLLPMVLKATPILFLVGIGIGVIHGVSFGLITLASQLFFDAVTETVTNQSGLTLAVGFGLVLGGVTIGTQVINGLHNFIGNTFVKKMSGHLGQHIHRKAVNIDPVSYESPKLLDDINKAQQGMTNSLYMLMIVMMIVTFYLPYFLFMGGYLFTLQPILAYSLLFIFVPVLLNQLIRGIVFARLEDQAAPIRREYEYYERCMSDRSYFKETRILGALAFFKDLYQTAIVLLGKKTWDAELKTGLLELGMRMLTLAGYFGVLYLLFDALLQGEVSLGAFAAVFASIGTMFAIMEELFARQIGGLTRNLGTVRNFMRFLEIPERTGQDIALHAEDGVVLDDVSFRYPGADADSLTAVSLEIRKGETIAIVGENGSGKTTLVKLIIGLYLPTKGCVNIAGVDTREVSAQSIYPNISAVFQKYQRYQMTLDENIEISDKAAQRETAVTREQQITNAATKADLDVRSTSFPEGLATMLSREFDGVDLSGGQWQRVAIARGFYRAHGLIVLDEPTAAIDPIEETRIYHKFAEISANKTAIIVTHRLGSAKIADRIIVMDQGRIAESGTHEELMRSNGKYAEMYQAQAKWYVG